MLHIVRAEAYYFSPQRMTRIMNEGWASYWHSRLLTGGILDPSEILDFADCHSSATMSGPGQVNPYKLGIELFRHAVARDEDIFQLRRVHNDVSLVHKLVDEEFALDFLTAGRKVIAFRFAQEHAIPRSTAYDFRIASRSTERYFADLRWNDELLWIAGNPNDPYGCYAYVYQRIP